jgi:hypothetical protein
VSLGRPIGVSKEAGVFVGEGSERGSKGQCFFGGSERGSNRLGNGPRARALIFIRPIERTTPNENTRVGPKDAPHEPT